MNDAMKLNKVSHKHKFITTLGVVILCILSLSTLLIQQSFNDTLLTLTLNIIISYLSIYAAYHIYRSWHEPIAQLQAFVHAKQHGQSNVSLEFQDASNPLAQLSRQIEQAFQHNARSAHTTFSHIPTVLDSLFQHWPQPVALFDKNNRLTFFNHPMHQHLSVPLLRDMTLAECGFNITNIHCQHLEFKKDWQLSCYQLGESEHTLIIANHIGAQLQDAKRASQADIIRVLSHELNNSLTPMASMADTLLSFEALPEQQTKQALSRIKSRSESLLSFINAYGSLSRLPTPVPRHFDMHKLVMANANEQAVTVSYNGEKSCYADPLLFEQLIINLLKNAREASNEQTLVILQSQCSGKSHVIEFIDNGPGFANLENALNPLYTTKSNGHGLGLALCNDIVQLHGGKITLYNVEAGACIKISIPLSRDN